METQTDLTLKLFGALRKYGTNAELEVKLPSGASVADLKSSLDAKLKELYPDFFDSELLDECAFATEDRVLLPQEKVPTTAYIAVLPPVCGG